MSDLFVTHQGGRILPPQEEANVLSPQEREKALMGGAICPNCGDTGCPHCAPAEEGDEYRPPEVRDLTLVGGCYSMGRYLSGWGVITLVGGERVRIHGRPT
jgi:hypothetical protein